MPKAELAGRLFWKRSKQDDETAAPQLSDTRLARAAQAARMFAWECDLTTGTMSWPGNAAAVIGCRKDELPVDMEGSHFFVHPEDRTGLNARFAEAVARREPGYVAEFRGIAEQVWRAEARIDYAPDGTATSITGVTQDVTEMALARQALKASEDEARARADEFQAIYDSAPVGLCVLDRELRFRRINTLLAKANGLSVADHLGRRIVDVLPQFHGELESQLNRVLAGEEIRGLEISGTRNDGSGRVGVFRVNWLPMRDADGGVQGIVISAEDISTEREAARALAESEALLAAIGASSPDLIYAKDREGRLLYANPATLAVLGHPMSAVAGRTSREVQKGRGGTEALANDLQVIANGASATFDEEVTDPAGAVRMFQSVKAPLVDREGAIIGMVGVSSDVTERRQAESDLRFSEERLRIAQDAAGLGIFQLDVDTRHLTGDARACEIFGLTGAGPHPLDPLLAQVCPDCRDKLAAAFQNAADGDAGTIALECRLLPYGSPDLIWIALSGRAVDGPRGARRIIGSIRDITARRLADERLHALNTDLEAQVASAVNERNRLWSLSDDLLVTADIGGQVYEVSESWQRLMGWEPAALLERPYTDVIHPDDLSRAAEDMVLLQQGQHSVSFENRVQAADGTWRNVSWRVSLEPGTSRIYGIGRDITAERAQAEALALAAAQLHEAQKLETIGKLTGGVAHDFNNLLSAINANLEVARKRNTDKAVTPLIEGAIRATERGVTLTGRLLAFARRQELRADTVHPATLIEGMTDLLDQSVGPGVKLRHVLSDDLGWIHVDVNQLELAILNLAVNGRDAMPEGGELTLRARNETMADDRAGDLRSGDYVVVSVTDTGVGMDEATRARAAEPFFTTKGAGKGTGLGLSMVHGLTAQSGGEMRIISAPGAGTTVELWLPRAEPKPEDLPLRLTESSRIAPPTRQAKRRILVVDDDVLVAMGTTIMLEDLGHDVVTTHSATEAIVAFGERGPFDLVITDQVMPGTSGTSLAAQLGDAVPVILASGYAELRDNGSAGLLRLAKPFGQAELERAIAVATTR
jgi:PAS domain S-box-containing protein